MCYLMLLNVTNFTRLLSKRPWYKAKPLAISSCSIMQKKGLVMTVESSSALQIQAINQQMEVCMEVYIQLVRAIWLL